MACEKGEAGMEDGETLWCWSEEANSFVAANMYVASAWGSEVSIKNRSPSERQAFAMADVA
eukprot:9954006-Alexandrium_andersonii.AAC.1